jgi:hypothetical protein
MFHKLFHVQPLHMCAAVSMYLCTTYVQADKCSDAHAFSTLCSVSSRLKHVFAPMRGDERDISGEIV